MEIGVGAAIADSDLASKLVDQAILAVEKVIGIGAGANKSAPAKTDTSSSSPKNDGGVGSRQVQTVPEIQHV